MSNLKAKSQNANLKEVNVKHRAYRLSLAIISLVNYFPNQRAFWIIADQLIRSCTSIGANMIEAQSSSSRREFIKYYEIALKSTNETKYWIALVRDTTSDRQLRNKAEQLLDEVTEIGKMLGASILTLKGKRF